MRRYRLMTSVVLFVALIPTSVDAVYVKFPLEYLVSDDTTVAVFRGTVGEVQMVPGGQIVSFEVEWVWKGRLSRTLTTYNWLRGSESLPEQRYFMRGQRYLVVVHRLDAQWRARFGDRRDALGVGYCTTTPIDSPEVERTIGDAEGWAPEERQ